MKPVGGAYGILKGHGKDFGKGNMMYEEDYRESVGKTVFKVFINSDRTAFGFDFDDGTQANYETEGDCCSSSWVEHITGLKNILGKPIIKIFHSDQVPDEIQDGCDEQDRKSVV